MISFKGKTALVTGGAGSLGRRLVKELLKPRYGVNTIRILDNHENGLVSFEVEMKNSFKKDFNRLRFLLGDIRDTKRMSRAMEQVDVCIHSAAQKHVHIAEFSPFESLQINVIGTQNCIDAALDADIDRFLFISSDKSVQATNTYGRCKALSESLVLDAEKYKGDRHTKLSVCRPCNFLNSDGSVYDVWNYQKGHGLPLTVTSPEATRYFLSFSQVVDFVVKCLKLMKGGEIFVPSGAEKLKIIDLAKKISDDIKITGLRKGEKLHELLMDPAEVDRAELVEGILVIK